MHQIKNSEIVGIDLGTTNTVLSYWDETGQPRTIPNLEGELKTPSVVYFGKSEVLVGTMAQNMIFVEPGCTVKEFKRDVGEDKIYFSKDGQDITPELCQAEVLKYVRKSAIEHFSDKRAASQAVITVPAYFSEKERQSVKKSAGIAGIQVIQLINEPTAAGLAYALNEQADSLVLIGDLGGGTFDVSLIKYSGGVADVLASSGDKHLGGKDVDDVILKMVTDKFRNDHGIEVTPEACPECFYGIWEEVVKQKHLLSSKQEVKLVGRAQGKQIVMDIHRKELNEAISPLMDRIKAIVLNMLKDAKVDQGDIKHVVFVGGSSRLPLFRDTFKAMFGENKLIGGRISPDLAVSAGAVIKAIRTVCNSGNKIVDDQLQAIPAPAIQCTDVMSHSLGIAVQDRVSAATYCSVILRKNTPVPAQVSKYYGSVSNDQKKFKISVVQGEDNKPISDCLMVAEEIMDLPPRGSDKESLEVVIGYNESGMVQVVVKDLVSKQEKEITTDFYSKNRS